MEAHRLDPLYDDDVANEALTAAARNFYGEPPVQEWTPSPQDEDKVERYKRAVRYFRAELQRVELVATAERERIEAWRKKHARDAEGALGYLEHQLRLFSEKQDRARHDSPNGVLKWVKGRERVEIADEDAFCRQCDERFVRITAAPARDAIMAAVKNGEPIPDGADIVRGDDTFKVEV